jgi:putative ABC transport system permease protein
VDWRIRRRTSQDEDLEEEIAFDLAAETDEHVRSGMSREEAERRSLLEFGNVLLMREETRDMWAWSRWERLSQDVRYALRQLAHRPGFAAVTICTLALGIGAATAMFSVVRAVLLRPLPYFEPHRLVRVSETNPLRNWTTASVAPANYADWRRMNTVFTDLACYMPGDAFLTGFGEPQRLRGMNVSGNLFDVLGVRPMLGRTFRDEETYEGSDRVVILSYNLWKTLFRGDPGIVGRSITLTEQNYEVVGVMPSDFFFVGRETQLWKPLGFKPSRFTEERRPHYLAVLGRLRPTVSPEHASEEMRAIAARLEQTYPDSNAKMGVRLDEFHGRLVQNDRRPLLILMGAVGLLFLIVCSNIANLQLGRASGRTREFGIRLALGASQARLARQLLTESLVMSLFGGAIGLALAAGCHYALVTLAPGAIPSFADMHVDRWVILFAASMTLLAPLLFGLAPILTSTHEGTLQDRSGTASRGSRAFRRALVASEVALSVVLVAASALLIQSLINLESVDPGFVPDRALSFKVTLPTIRYTRGRDIVRSVDEIEQHLRAQPGVDAAGASLALPLEGWAWSSDVTLEGRGTDDYAREIRFSSVTPDYFRAAGITLLRGRTFNQFDQWQSEPVAVVNETFERAYFREQSAVGKRIKFGRPSDENPWGTIVGVVTDTKHDSMDGRVQPFAYRPLTQNPNYTVGFVVRGAGITRSTVHRAVRAVDPNLAIDDLAALQELITTSLGDQHFRASLLAVFAGIALFLASLGIYGVLSYSVAQRAKEIGVRLALGAPVAQLFTMVVSEGMRPVIAGAMVGLAGAFGAARLLRTLLFDVAPSSPGTYVITTAIMVTVALGACALPARRAMRVDPSVLLREQ